MGEDEVLGWRERKREETARRIGETGFRLMAEHGYEATTLDAIAEASGISRRTFFHYYKSKEDILLAWQDGFAERFRSALLVNGPGETPLATMRSAQIALVRDADTNEIRTIDGVIRTSDRLRTANQAKYLILEGVAFETLCRLWPEPGRRERLRLAAMAGVGAMRLAFANWSSDAARRPLRAHIEATYAALAQELRNDGPATAPSDITNDRTPRTNG